MSTGIPFWLKEHCDRLTSNDATLRNLNLNIRHLDAGQLETFARALSQNSCLTSLNLTATLVPGPVRPESLQLLLSHPSLKDLHLSYNRLVDATIPSINDFHLVHLRLDHNALRDPLGLWQILQSNSTLEVLLLDCNRISDASCPALAAALEEEKCALRELGLRHNAITSSGATLLRDAIRRSNTTLRHLHLAGNEGISNDERAVIDFWCLANARGRRRWKSLAVTAGVVAELVRHPSVLLLFIRTRPEIVGALNRSVAGQKRAHCRKNTEP